MPEIELHAVSQASWEMQAMRLANSKGEICFGVSGTIGNAVPTSAGGRQRTELWKVAVATAVMSARETVSWSPISHFAITVGFSFHWPSHGNCLMDIENFLKPTLDAVAAGLFAPYDQDWQQLARWNFDDSRFEHLLIHRLHDAICATDEGALLQISAS